MQARQTWYPIAARERERAVHTGLGTPFTQCLAVSVVWTGVKIEMLGIPAQFLFATICGVKKTDVEHPQPSRHVRS